MEGITIRRMTEEDLDAVLRVESVSFPLPWSRNHFLSELRSPLSFPLVAESGEGIILGYACPMLVLDEGQILNVAVGPDHRGQGIGRLILDEVIREFRELGATFVALEVRPSNAAAISLYTRCGFIVTGRRRAYYENGEDAILMEYEIVGHGEQRDEF
jgi:[ribosomal protein S18]-alanine N-acetyltransferase